MSMVDLSNMYPEVSTRQYDLRKDADVLKNTTTLSEDKITREGDKPKHTRRFENIAKSQAPPE